MKIAIESTPIITHLDGVPCRVWEGVTESGTPCKVFVHRVAVHNADNAQQFERELQEQLQPGIVIPLRNVL